MSEKTNHNGRLVVVSNRLPIVISEEEGELKATRGSGGLISALGPVLKDRGGVWIGWPGPVGAEREAQVTQLLEMENSNTEFFLQPVFLTDEEVKLYYEGFANEIIWPLFHDLPSACRFDPAYWYAAEKVNFKFAIEISQKRESKDFIWVHDYHLMLVGHELRKLGVEGKMGYFLHIPFPSLDIFTKIPWRFQILRALLEYDLVGFQTMRDKRNFIQCVKRLLPEIKMVNKNYGHACLTTTREVQVGTFPIGIDYQEFSTLAAGMEVDDQVWLNQEHLQGQRIVFSCDRLDISKGIPYRLEAIRHLLKTHPEVHEKVTFFQIVIPSRIEITEYKELKNEIDRLVGEINSQFTTTGWIPIKYLFHSVSLMELVALYRLSEIVLITPIKDGMNLVAKEYVASNINENGVLVLSEFAGAAVQFQGEALLINPYDIEGVAETIYAALTLPLEERKKRMHKMRRNVQRSDVFWWVRTFLNAALPEEQHEFPVIEEFIPDEANSPSPN